MGTLCDVFHKKHAFLDISAPRNFDSYCKTGFVFISVIFSVAATLGCHCMLAFTFWEPFVAMVCFFYNFTKFFRELRTMNVYEHELHHT